MSIFLTKNSLPWIQASSFFMFSFSWRKLFSFIPYMQLYPFSYSYFFPHHLLLGFSYRINGFCMIVRLLLPPSPCTIRKVSESLTLKQLKKNLKNIILKVSWIFFLPFQLSPRLTRFNEKKSFTSEKCGSGPYLTLIALLYYHECIPKLHSQKVQGKELSRN